MAVKPSAIFKAVTSVVGKSAEVFSHLHTATDLLGAIKGHEPSKDAPAYVKGLYGVLGKGDERAFEVLLNQLEDKWRRKPAARRGPNPREVLSGFFSWHFRHHSMEDKVLTWWYGNEFRVFVTRMGSSDGHTEGTEERVAESRDAATGATVKTVTKKELKSSGSNNALNFLQTMVDIIRSQPEQDVEPRRLPGYRKLLDYLEAFHYPHIPEGVRGRLPTVVATVAATTVAAGTATRDATRRNLEAAANSIEAKVDEKRRNRGFWENLSRKL